MLIAVAAGFAVAFAAPLLAMWLRGWSNWALALYPAAVTAWLCSLAGPIAEGTLPSESFAWAPSLGLSLSFRIDGLSLLLALLISGIGTVVMIYTGGYLGKHPLIGRFYGFLLAFMASMLGVVLSDNLLLMFLFWELTSITSYFLIGFDSNNRESRTAALQALLVTGSGGLVLLAGLLLLGMTAGSFEISELLTRRTVLEQDARTPWILVLILTGAFTKSAQFPFHFWLPNAMAAPTPASAYLHSSTMVKAGIYLLARFQILFEGTSTWYWLVTSAGTITMVAGAYLALRETYFKRVLAYTTLSVLGLLTMLLGIGGSAAVQAAIVFLLAHAFYKAGLFLVAGAVDHETGERDLQRLGGLAGKMPVITAAGVLSALSMAGVIGTIGFLSKELMFESVLNSADAFVLTTASLATAVMLVAVAVMVGWQPFFGAAKQTDRVPHNGPISLWLGPLLLAMLGVTTGVIPWILSVPIVSPAVSAVLAETTAIDLHVWHGISVALVLDVLALIGGVTLFVFIRPVREKLKAWDRTSAYGPAKWYDAGLNGLIEFADWQTRILQSGYLRRYLLTVVLTTVLLVGGVMLFSGTLPPEIFQFRDLQIHELGLSVIILFAAGMAIHTQSRLAAVAALGVVGYGVGILYIMFGAPDLAITQFVIETLTVILFVLVLYRLEPYQSLSSNVTRYRDIIISLSAGALMTVLILLAGSSPWFPSISDYYSQNSAVLAHGRNVVNVILVDFRGIDTLGEITVLSVAGLGVYALLKLRPEQRKDDT